LRTVFDQMYRGSTAYRNGCVTARMAQSEIWINASGVPMIRGYEHITDDLDPEEPRKRPNATATLTDVAEGLIVSASFGGPLNMNGSAGVGGGTTTTRAPVDFSIPLQPKERLRRHAMERETKARVANAILASAAVNTTTLSAAAVGTPTSPPPRPTPTIVTAADVTTTIATTMIAATTTETTLLPLPSVGSSLSTLA
jgi:hypothetical protein